MKPSSYNDKYEGDLELSTLFQNRLQDLKNEIKVQLPCKVHAIDHINNQVDLEILDYDVDNNGNLINFPIIPNVPIRQPMDSSMAYIRLPIQIGDIGTVEFFDSSTDDLVISNIYNYDYTEEWHSLNNGLFTNGFLPQNKLFNYDYNSKIVIGTKTGNFVLKINSNDELEIIAPKISMTAESVNITGTVNVTGDINCSQTVTGNTDVIGGGKSLKSHTHSGVQTGSGNTGTPN